MRRCGRRRIRCSMSSAKTISERRSPRATRSQRNCTKFCSNGSNTSNGTEPLQNDSLSGWERVGVRVGKLRLMALAEFCHEGCELLNAFPRHRVVDRGPDAADAAMPFQAVQAAIF